VSANKNATNWLEPFEQYLLESGLAPATIASYMTDVKLFYHALQKPVTACDVTRFDVLSYKQQLLDQRTAVATINKKVNSLQAFNQFLNVKGARKEVFISLRKDKIKVAAGSEDEVEVLTEAETNRLLAYLEQTGHRLRNRLIIHLLLYTGLRVSELCAVKLADVDRLGATIRVIGKGGTYREVPLRPGVVDLIQQ
jgi:integrase/recombinase XerD